MEKETVFSETMFLGDPCPEVTSGKIYWTGVQFVRRQFIDWRREIQSIVSSWESSGCLEFGCELL
jgi:hypothetical protein